MTGEVQSLLRGLAVLEALAEFDANGATLAEIADRTGLSPSTAHRLLATFVEQDYVTRGRDRNTYVLGHRIIGVAATVQMRTAHLRVVARPCLEAIAEEVGYSDERSLRRACVQWFGIPLAQYREEIRKS